MLRRPSFCSPQAALDYRRVEAALRYLDTHATQQPELEGVAKAMGLSPHHCQRTFQRWAGVSPKRYLQFLTKEHAKRLLKEGQTVLETAHRVGLSGGGRLHDLLVTTEALSPGEIARQGAGLAVRWGVHPSAFGACLVGLTARGLCAMSFLAEGRVDSGLCELHARWPLAEFHHDPRATRAVLAQVFTNAPNGPAVPVLLRGSRFQLRVWQALLEVPPGALRSYGQLASQIGQPGAARAVGHAMSDNPIGYLIPCHRVIRGVGEVGQYRWGSARKRALIAWESAWSTQQPSREMVSR